MADVLKRKPQHPRDRNEWKSGKFPGNPPCFKFEYCTSIKDTFKTIASTVQGSTSPNRLLRVAKDLSWRDIAQFNYGTTNPRELNWYLENFNGCTHVRKANYVFDKKDTAPFLWIPALIADLPVNIPLEGLQVKLPPPACPFTAAARRRFKDIDSNNRGFLERGHIRQQLLSRTFNGADGALIATLIEQYSALEDLSNDELGPEMNGVSKADLAEFDRQWAASPPTQVVLNVMYWFNKFQSKIAATNRKLTAPGGAEPSAVCQGRFGDCWFLCVLAALSKERLNSFLQSNVKPTSNGEYSVQFKDRSDAIVVSSPTDSQLALLGSSGANGTWLPVLELALGASSDVADPLAGLDSFQWGSLVQSKGVKMITGNSADGDMLGMTTESTTRQKLTATFAAGKLVVSGINNVPNDSGFSKWVFGDRKGWPTAHAYSVLAFNDGKSEITVRNPWGEDPSGAPTPKGQVIPFSDFMQVFSNVNYEE